MVQIPLTIPRVSARQTMSTSVPFQWYKKQNLSMI